MCYSSADVLETHPLLDKGYQLELLNVLLLMVLLVPCEVELDKIGKVGHPTVPQLVS